MMLLTRSLAVNFMALLGVSCLWSLPTATAQPPQTEGAPSLVPAETDPSDTRYQPAEDRRPSVAGAEHPAFRPGAVLEGSVLATLGGNTGQDQHSEQLCHTAEALLEAARLLSEMPTNTHRTVLIHQLRTEAVTCLREAGY